MKTSHRVIVGIAAALVAAGITLHLSGRSAAWLGRRPAAELNSGVAQPLGDATLLGKWQTLPSGIVVSCEGMKEPISAGQPMVWEIERGSSEGKYLAKTASGCPLELVGSDRLIELAHPTECRTTQGPGTLTTSFNTLTIELLEGRKASIRSKGATVVASERATVRCTFGGSSTAERL